MSAASWILVGSAVWVSGVTFTLALCRAAARADELMDVWGDEPDTTFERIPRIYDQEWTRFMDEHSELSGG